MSLLTNNYANNLIPPTIITNQPTTSTVFQFDWGWYTCKMAQ